MFVVWNIEEISAGMKYWFYSRPETVTGWVCVMIGAVDLPPPMLSREYWEDSRS